MNPVVVARYNTAEAGIFVLVPNDNVVRATPVKCGVVSRVDTRWSSLRLEPALRLGLLSIATSTISMTVIPDMGRWVIS